MPKVSKIESMGHAAEALERYHDATGTRNAKASTVHRWLATVGVHMSRQAVMYWLERRALAPEVTQAIAPTVEVVHSPARIVAPEVQAIMDECMRQARSGEATTGSAKVLDTALRAALAQRILGGQR